MLIGLNAVQTDFFELSGADFFFVLLFQLVLVRLARLVLAVLLALALLVLVVLEPFFSRDGTNSKKSKLNKDKN